MKQLMTSKLRKVFGILLAAALCACLAACGGGNKEAAAEQTTEAQTAEAAEATTEAESATEAETTTEAKEEYKTIGKESADAVSFLVSNKTGQDITAVSLIQSDAEEAAENLLADKDVFKKDETRKVYIDLSEDQAEQVTEAQEDAANEKELPPEYVLVLTLADASELNLHAFPVEDIANGDILVKDGVGYLVYENLSGKKDISTLMAEQTIAGVSDTPEAPAAEAPQDVAAEAPANEEQVYVEEPVNQEPVYEEPVNEEPVNQEPVYEEPVNDAPAEPAAPEGSEDDGCVEDGLFY